MSNHIRLSITSRLIILALLPLLVFEIIFSWYHIKSSVDSATATLNDNGHLISEQLAEASEFYLISGDYDKIDELISKAFKREYVTFISVHNENGISIAQHSNINFRPENTQQYLYFKKNISNSQIYTTDIFELESDNREQQNIGFLHLYLSKNLITEKANSALKNAALFSILIFIVAFFFVAVFAKQITTPIYELLLHIQNAEKGNLGDTIKNIEPNEIGILQEGFNNMTQSLLANRIQLDIKIKNATLKLMDMVSELENKNAELESTKNDALKANKIKSSFLANMSHEIRTPINGIKGFIGLLSKSPLNDEQKRFTKIIQQSSTDLITIVNEILDFSKIESGKLSIETHSFDLIDSIESVRDQFFPAALEKSIDIYLSIYSDVPRHIYGDQTRLKQILINLIGNAIKFTNTGYIQIKIFLPDTDDDQIQFDINDTGIGINDKDKSQLFNAFQQIESETNRRYSGTGLGLVISRKLARLMKGDITLSSKKSIGSTFSLTLPIRIDKTISTTVNNRLGDDLFFLVSSKNVNISELQSLFTRAELMTETSIISSDEELVQAHKSIALSLKHIQYLVIDNRHMPEQHCSSLIHDFKHQCKIMNIDYKQKTAYEGCFFLSSTTHSAQLTTSILAAQQAPSHDDIQPPQKPDSKRILIVDDNEINLTFAFELLTQWGHKATQANSALNALDAYQRYPFDLVLMDIQMPEYDGIDGMKMLRKAPTNKGTPIIALTANALPEEENRLRKIGFDDYISKPIDEEVLANIINQDKTAIRLKKTSEAQLVSINYEGTLKLSGNNKDLVEQVFQLLLKEIPVYQENFNVAFKHKNIELFKTTKHKLEGTTCYANLPKLKSLLIKATQMTDFDNDFTKNILKELNKLDKILRSF